MLNIPTYLLLIYTNVQKKAPVAKIITLDIKKITLFLFE